MLDGWCVERIVSLNICHSRHVHPSLGDFLSTNLVHMLTFAIDGGNLLAVFVPRAVTIHPPPACQEAKFWIQYFTIYSFFGLDKHANPGLIYTCGTFMRTSGVSWGLASGCTTWLIKLCVKKNNNKQTKRQQLFIFIWLKVSASDHCFVFLESRYTQSGPNIQTAPRIITCMGPQRFFFFFFFRFTRPPQSTGRLWNKDTVAANRTCGDSQAEAARWTTWEGRVSCVVVLF